MKLEFLAGYVDEEQNVHKDFTIREITGADEEALSKRDIKENGGKFVNTLLERCITSIGEITPKDVGMAKWKEIIRSLSVGDQDYALLQIRKETLGEEIEMSHTCPMCNTALTTIVDVDEIAINPFGGEFTVDFTLPKGYKDKEGNVHTMGRLRFPKGLDREILDPVARKNIGQANTLLITRCIEELGTVYLTDKVVRELGLRDREYLLKLLKENNFGVNLFTDITCTDCGHEFKTTLNMVNFL